MSFSIKQYAWRYFLLQSEKSWEKPIKRSMKLCPMKPLTKGQVADVKNFFKKYIGREVPIYWHQYLYSRNGIWSEKYIPTSIYNSEIIYRLNKFQFCNAYVDKGVYDVWFHDINRPKTIIKNVNGFFYDGQRTITLGEAIDRCANLNEAIIKPSLGGTWGIGVKLIKTMGGVLVDSDQTVKQLFDSYQKNFIIQERFEQHPDLAKLNPTSLNTIRVMSYRRNDEVLILYAVIRIGRENQIIDNETAGGIKADIDLTTGCIKGNAVGNPKEATMSYTDVGTFINGYRLPCFNKLLDTVKEMHLRLPYFNLIGWDMTVDTNGVPALIEWNRAPELSQVAHGPAFGELTEDILTYAMSRENTRFSGGFWSFNIII